MRNTKLQMKLAFNSFVHWCAISFCYNRLFNFNGGKSENYICLLPNPIFHGNSDCDFKDIDMRWLQSVGQWDDVQVGEQGHAPCSLTSKTLARPDSCATSLTWPPPIVTSTTTTTAIENVILWSISLIRKKIEALKRIFVQLFSFKVCIFIDFLSLKVLISHFIESILKPAKYN